MAPEERNGIIGVPVDLDIIMKRFHVLLDVLRVVVYEHLWLHESNDVHFDSSFSKFLQYSIQSSHFIIDFIRSFEQEIGCNHPSSDTNLPSSAL